ncbi:MAG TPA: response regulator [Flavobacteriaceae bacterium]|nr:response regulator [Flavobacteriaceae bacterium]
MNQVTIFMVDDHLTQIEGYKAVLQYNKSGYRINTIARQNCKDAYDFVTSSPEAAKIDMVFLDLNLPPYEEMKLFSGEDLALFMKAAIPNAKIVILTSHTEAFRLYNILKTIQPTGLLVKSDFSSEELINAFDVIANGGFYYTETVEKSKKELISRESYLDSYNRKIIELLAQGVKTKNIPDHINLSQSAIEKRKAQIKNYLCIEKGTDEDIVREARKLGFV